MTHTVSVRPGVGVTIYGNLPRDIHPEVVGACDHVTLHTAADAGDVRNAARVRSLGCNRVWLAIPANYLVRKSDDDAVREVERCARVALDMGAEVFELNGEGSSDGQTPGDWIGANPAESERLEELAVKLAEAARAVLGERCALAWTSHDGRRFRIPRRFLKLLDLHAMQHYPALPHEKGQPPPPLITQRGMEKRVNWSRGGWDVLADRGDVPGNVLPYGDRWSMYTQAHGLSLAATVWALCEAATARLWAYPGSWGDKALPALRMAREIRRNVQPGVDAIENWQQAKGLEPDGVIGPNTLRELAAVTGP